MPKKILLVAGIVMLFACIALSANAQKSYNPPINQEVKEYFDMGWKRCDSAMAIYYRIITYQAPNIPKGKVRDYYGNGKLQSEFSASYIDYTNDKNIKNIDTAKWYYENGNSKQIAVYNDSNQLHGILKGYFESGKLSYEFPYSKDKQNGLQKSYYESGKLMYKSLYSEGKQNGIEKKYYYESDKLAYELPYVEDKRNGIAKWYYESGKLKCKLPYTDGKKNGLEKEYYKSGKLRYKLPYTDGKQNGLKKEYYENGKLKYESTYKDGKLDGVVIYYNEDGSISKKQYYENGVERH